jgi:hypothetical protein
MNSRDCSTARPFPSASAARRPGPSPTSSSSTTTTPNAIPGLGLHTPASVHFGTAAGVRTQRAKVLDAAYAAHPKSFVNKAPPPPLYDAQKKS